MCVYSNVFTSASFMNPATRNRRTDRFTDPRQETETDDEFIHTRRIRILDPSLSTDVWAAVTESCT